MSKQRNSKKHRKTNSKQTRTPKYIFVVGGVMSGLGKGIATSSLSLLLQQRGYTVTTIKIDPYVNVDAGTMNPVEHGEVFVLDSGLECDQDMGNYERFLNTSLPAINYMTTGMVYQTVINKERQLEYGGDCVQVVPDIPNEVIRRIRQAQKESKADITLVEVGGTVGEYENLLYLEAARMMRLEAPDDVLFTLVSYLPVPKMVGEMKTKPTQHASRTLNGAGLQADLLVGRSEQPLDDVRKKKLATLCNIRSDRVVSAPDSESVYDVPLVFEEDNLSEKVLKSFNMSAPAADLKDWKRYVTQSKNTKQTVRIGIVGKYFYSGDYVMADSYISVIEAIKHAWASYNVEPQIEWLNSEAFEEEDAALMDLQMYDGIIVPGGFGSRGIEGKLQAIRIIREQKIPYLGLCYGMQLAVIEFARNIVGISEAHTTEVNPNTAEPVIDVMPDQDQLVKNQNLGGTMRLGAYNCDIASRTLTRRLYQRSQVSERHRHRYEVNNEYRDQLEEAGLSFPGTNPELGLIEITEIPNHPFFIGTQFHPEFLSRSLRPHPLFKGLVRAAMNR
ncbi:MAG: CTP synthase [Candidatus Paceibacteria bacterium]